ncbi:hypothetical protein EUGRSUZ_L01320 [Eucalyptus grandis]|uniref:Homing endonuclease LAGLIDADG domain-containing protein n=1 Tax=Eucalyptus grandis TaxID=71139 RepID=A0A058ZTG2_EUCGR|nr:hypothetical protein EUGRSUZ_L01320 [Eucalyptus grandis]
MLLGATATELSLPPLPAAAAVALPASSGSSMRGSLSLLRSLSLSLHHRGGGGGGGRSALLLLSQSRRLSFAALRLPFSRPPLLVSARASPASLSSSVEQVVDGPDSDENWDFTSRGGDSDGFSFDVGSVGSDMRQLASPSPAVEVRELEEVPEQWRRAKLAWLCKELPAQKGGTLVRILNAQRKWMRQEDATYVAVHCMRIRENETAFKVYKWMMQQHWYKFDFALATKLADYLGKNRKFAKCREIFDDIINQGRVPSESTFHVLIVAYLSASKLGGYQPRLSLHNSLFRALVSGSGALSKHHLKQAEFIFHNLVTSGLEIHNDIYGGLIWLHSYQDTIDGERIAELRKEMQESGIEETREVLLSVLRACSKEGNSDEAERVWLKLQHLGDKLPSLAYVYKMEVYAKVAEHVKSLNLFREMQERLGSATVAAYHKIIEVICKAQDVELAESLMKEFKNSGLKPLGPSFIDMMNMYFNLGLHDKLESAFSQCVEKCQPNRVIYGIYLDSLVRIGDISKAEEIFSEMHSSGAIGISGRNCNSILGGYLSAGDYVKAEKVYHLKCEKKYEIERASMEKLDPILSLRGKAVKKPVSLKLTKEQREILVGMLLGGLQIDSDEQRKNHMIKFKFNENSGMHSALKRHIYEHYHEWLHPSCKLDDNSNEIPNSFSTICHSYFGFYADQFWPRGKPVIPKLIHRWLSPCALAYWYMYGGYRMSSGDILLKLRGSQEGVERVVKALKAKSLDCRVKRKGQVYWIGLLGSNSTWFWKLIEPYVLDLNFAQEDDGEILSFNSGSDSDKNSDNTEEDR